MQPCVVGGMSYWTELGVPAGLVMEEVQDYPTSTHSRKTSNDTLQERIWDLVCLWSRQSYQVMARFHVRVEILWDKVSGYFCMNLFFIFRFVSSLLCMGIFQMFCRQRTFKRSVLCCNNQQCPVCSLKIVVCCYLFSPSMWSCIFIFQIGPDFFKEYWATELRSF